MDPIETLRDALFGNPPILTYPPSREGTLKAFTELKIETEAGIAAAATSGTDLAAAEALIAPLADRALAAQNSAQQSLSQARAIASNLPAQIANSIEPAIAIATASASASAERSNEQANRAQAAADIASSGVAAYFETRAELNAAIPADGTVVRVWKDETQGNAYTEYRIEGGVPVYKLRIVGNQRTTRVVVAASDSLDKDGADIVLPAGNDQQNAINQLLTNLQNTHAKKVEFRSGTYELTDHIYVDTSHITLEAEARGFWTQYTAPGSQAFSYPRSIPGAPGGARFVQRDPSKGVFRVGNPDGGGERHNAIRFLDLSMDVAQGVLSTGTAIYDRKISDCCVVEGCFIRGFPRALDLLWDAGWVKNNNIQDLPDNPADPKQAAVALWGFLNVCTDNLIFQCGGNGLRVGSINSMYSNNTIGQCTGDLVWISNRANKFTSNAVTGMTDGNYGIIVGGEKGDALFYNDCFANVIANNTIQMIHCDLDPLPGMTGLAKSGICLGKDGADFGGAAYATVVNGNNLSSAKVPRGSSPGWGIEIRNGGDFNCITGNIVDGDGWRHNPPQSADPGSVNYGSGGSNVTSPNVLVP